MEGFVTAKIRKLFLIFACVEDCGKWDDFVDAAILKVSGELKDGADSSDPRISFYCAAVANLLYHETLCARGAALPTYAGEIPAAAKGSCELAQRLALAYRENAANLLKDNNFAFRAV